MTITTTQLSTRLRTWTLVAGLTGLVVAFGALIGGGFLWLFVALAVGMNVVGYFYSDRIALRLARAQPLPEAEAPEVYESVRALAARAQIPMPRLFPPSPWPARAANAIDVGAEPGTLVRFAGDEFASAFCADTTVHDVGLRDLLGAARLSGAWPEQLVLHGVQPGSTTLGTELTPTVAAALDGLVDSVVRELAGWDAALLHAGAATG
jgi:hypothetical protein